MDSCEIIAWHGRAVNRLDITEGLDTRDTFRYNGPMDHTIDYRADIPWGAAVQTALDVLEARHPGDSVEWDGIGSVITVKRWVVGPRSNLTVSILIVARYTVMPKSRGFHGITTKYGEAPWMLREVPPSWNDSTT